MEAEGKIIFALVGFLVLGIIIGSIFHFIFTGSDISPNTNSKLSIINYSIGEDNLGNLAVTGIAKNTGNTKLNYGEVKVNFYDKDGTLISNSFATFNDLNPGEQWKFKALYVGTEPSSVDNYTLILGFVG